MKLIQPDKHFLSLSCKELGSALWKTRRMGRWKQLLELPLQFAYSLQAGNDF